LTEETDLTYEGIETILHFVHFRLPSFYEETDLTYEGIETFNSIYQLRAQSSEETDLTYEGIETLPQRQQRVRS